jgi:hypothetical protein
MKTRRLCAVTLTGCLAVAGVYPQLSAAAPPPKAALPVAADVKAVEAQLLAAQGQIVAGNLDAGLKTFAEVRGKAIPALAPRIVFIEKLVEVRVADRLGDQAKVSAGLTESLKQAGQPDQVTACWQLGLSLAQAAVAAKNPAAAGLMEFLGTQAGPAMRQFGPHLEVAKLRMAAGQAASAEAELNKAAARISSAADRAAWAAAVADLAKLVDGGQAPQAGVDLFERLRKAAPAPAQLALDMVEGRALLARGELERCAEVLQRALVGVKTAKEQALPVLALSYELAVAYHKANNIESANQALREAEAMAEALPPSAEVTAVRCNALVAGGRADSAAEIAWNAALSAKQPAQRQQMLLLYVPAAVAAGRDGEILAKLQSMKAPAGIFTAAAGALAQAGKAEAAMAMLEAVTPQAAAADPQVAGGMIAVIGQMHQQHQQAAARQAARCRAIAAEYAAAAKKAEAAKDAKTAASHAKQAVAFQALATQLEK